MRTSWDDNTKIKRIQELLTIYNRMAPSLRPDERARMDRFISGYTGEIMVDGVPSQGMLEGSLRRFCPRLQRAWQLDSLPNSVQVLQAY